MGPYRGFRLTLILTTVLFVVVAFSSMAQAQATRTWVSGVGDDANPCSTAPCKTFAGAISKTAAGGEINVLDPGGFGAVTITKSISIVNEGSLGSILASLTNGVVINAGTTDVVLLRGLDINGTGNGLKGISFLAGGVLHVENCTISGFADGISFAPTTGGKLFIKDTNVRSNGRGIFIDSAGTAQVTIDRTRSEGNGSTGIRIEDNVLGTIRESVFAGNGGKGIAVQPTAGSAIVDIESSVSTHNSLTGIAAGGGGGSATVRISNVTVTDNPTGLDILAGGSIGSFGNNKIVGNGASDPPTFAILPQ